MRSSTAMLRRAALMLVVLNGSLATRPTTGHRLFMTEADKPASSELVYSGEGDPTVAESNVASLGWLNKLLSEIWPQTSAAINEIVQVDVNAQLAALLPGPLKTLKVQPFTLSHAPVLGPIKVYKSTDGLKLMLGLSFLSQDPISMSTDGIMGSGYGKISAGIESVSLTGELVIHLAPIIGSVPVIGGATIYFLNQPEININFIGLADIADLPGASGIVRNIIDSSIAGIAVLPNCIGVPIATPEQGVHLSYFKQPEAIALVRITIKQARTLEGKDWSLFSKATSDPYVLVQIADRSWSSSVVKKTLNPVWTTGNLQDFVVFDAEQTVQLSVYDEDHMNRDDLIGKTAPLRYGTVVGTTGTWPIADKKGVLAGTLTAEVQQFRIDKCAGSRNGVLLRVDVDKIAMPASIAVSAKAIFTIKGESKTTATGSIPISVDQKLQEIVANMHEAKMKKSQIAKLTGLTAAKVAQTIKVLDANAGDYSGFVDLSIGSKLYFPNPSLDLMGGEEMTVKILDDKGHMLVEGKIDLAQIGLLDGIGSRNGCEVQKSMLIEATGGRRVLVRFTVKLFSLS